MDIFGIGGWELIAILIIMLMVAGPKRMIQWAYIMGTYVAKLRKMWTETMAMVQKEFDQAGVDIKVPKEPPTRGSLNKAASDVLKPFTAPLQEAVNEVNTELQQTKEAVNLSNGYNPPSKETPPPDDNKPDQNFGTWSSPKKTE